MKKDLGCLGYIGDEILSSYVGIVIDIFTRIPIKQPGFNGEYRAGFFVVAHSSHGFFLG